MDKEPTKVVEKKKFWLKLKEDFFDNEKIRIIESMPNGEKYVLFLLKLQTKSIRNVGHLRLNAEIPYSEQMLATITNTNIDIVRSAIKVLQRVGFIQILDDNTYFMTKVAELTGSETDSAERVRQHRARIENDKQELKALQCNTDVTKCNANIELELELDTELEKNIDLERNKEINTLAKPKRFMPPTIDEIKSYIVEKGYSVNAEKFYNHYQANGWVQGRGKPIKCWKSAVSYWQSNRGNFSNSQNDGLTTEQKLKIAEEM